LAVNPCRTAFAATAVCQLAFRTGAPERIASIGLDLSKKGLVCAAIGSFAGGAFRIDALIKGRAGWALAGTLSLRLPTQARRLH
jgi:hypothetical protein